MSLRNVIDLLLLAAIWGASFLFTRIAAPEIGAAPLVALRVGIAAAFLVPMLIVRQGMAPFRAHAGPLLLLGVVNSAVPFLFFAYAATHITAGYSAILNATAPLWGALVAAVWLKDRLPMAAVGGLAIGFSGVVILVAGRSSFMLRGDALAIAACLLATLCYGFGVNYTKRYTGGVSPLAIAAGSQLAAAVVLAPAAVVTWPEPAISSGLWMAVAALGIFCTGVAYILYFRLIRSLGPARAISVTYLIPIFGMVWGRIFLGEAITMPMLAGTAVILLGVALTTGAVRPVVPAAVKAAGGVTAP